MTRYDTDLEHRPNAGSRDRRFTSDRDNGVGPGPAPDRTRDNRDNGDTSRNHGRNSGSYTSQRYGQHEAQNDRHSRGESRSHAPGRQQQDWNDDYGRERPRNRGERNESYTALQQGHRQSESFSSRAGGANAGRDRNYTMNDGSSERDYGRAPRRIDDGDNRPQVPSRDDVHGQNGQDYD
jgi:hypothetical protein